MPPEKASGTEAGFGPRRVELSRELGGGVLGKARLPWREDGQVRLDICAVEGPEESRARGWILTLGAPMLTDSLGAGLVGGEQR